MKKVEKYPFKRLVFYNCHANKSYWDEHWRQLRIEDLLNDSFFKEPFRMYLSNAGKLLEVGCGLGQHVKMLADMGYDIEGIDFSRSAIRKAKEFDRELSVIVGDVLSLPYRGCSFSGCISLGVVEHFEEGPEDAIREMHRVLVEDGMLLISVPFFNPLRRMKGRIGRYAKLNKGEREFYQYAFTIDEFTSILKQCGFVPLKIIKYDAKDGFKDEIPHLRKIGYHFERRSQKIKKTKQIHGENQYNFLTQLILKILNSKILCRVMAHMMLFIAKKGHYEVVH